MQKSKTPEELEQEHREQVEAFQDAVEAIARVCHEANRAHCENMGDDSQVPWDKAPDWQKDSARAGVKMHLTGQHRVEDSHAAWAKQKTEDGWVHGETKDAKAKTHPCLVPFNELPEGHQLKDHLFRGICHSFKHAVVVPKGY